VAYFEQGVTYFQMKENTSSKRLLKLAMAESPKIIAIPLFMADLLIDEKQFAEAKTYIEKALLINNNELYAYTVMRRMLREQSGHKAEYEYFQKIFPQFIDNHEFLHSYCYFIVIEYESRDEQLLNEALFYLRKIKNEGYDDEYLEYDLAKTCFLLKKDAESVGHLKAFVNELKLRNPLADSYIIEIYVEPCGQEIFEEHKAEIEENIHAMFINLIDETQEERNMIHGIFYGKDKNSN